MQQLAEAQVNPEVPVNENFETLSAFSIYGKRHAFSSGMTWAYYGSNSTGMQGSCKWGGFTVNEGTLTLTASSTNYIVVAKATGVISVSTSATNWDNSTDYVRVYKVTTGSSAVTATEDHRVGAGGVHGGGGGGGAGDGLSTDIAYNDATTFRAFGDSITTGVGASDSAHAYINLLADRRGLTLTNLATSGDMVADQADDVYGVTVVDGDQSTVMIGTNDHRIYTTGGYAQGAFKRGHMALLAWLAIPHAYKVTGQGGSVTYGGTWTNTAVYGGALGKKTAANGATATFTVYGTVVYVATIIQQAKTCTFTISVDGVDYGTYNCGPGGGDITAASGRDYMPSLIRIPGLSEGPHTVVLTSVSCDASNPIYFDWAAGNLPGPSKDGPNVFVGNIPRYSATGYSTYGGSDATITIFNQIVRHNVETLADDGLQIALADSCSRLNPTTDLEVAGLHPDDSGHEVIAQAFQEAMNQIGKPRAAMRQPLERVRLKTLTGTSYDLPMGDASTELLMDNASAITLNVYPWNALPMEIGTVVPIRQVGAGKVTISPQAGVTINHASSLSTRAQNSLIALRLRKPNIWDLSGDMQ